MVVMLKEKLISDSQINFSTFMFLLKIISQMISHLRLAKDSFFVTLKISYVKLSKNWIY